MAESMQAGQWAELKTENIVGLAWFPELKSLVFASGGGGKGSRDLYNLDAAGKVTTPKAGPIGVGTSRPSSPPIRSAATS